MECRRQRSKVLLKCCALHTFDVIDGQRQNMHEKRIRVIEGKNAHDQIAFCAFHSF